jgi:hypothetical protein
LAVLLVEFDEGVLEDLVALARGAFDKLVCFFDDFANGLTGVDLAVFFTAVFVLEVAAFEVSDFEFAAFEVSAFEFAAFEVLALEVLAFEVVAFEVTALDELSGVISHLLLFDVIGLAFGAIF